MRPALPRSRRARIMASPRRKNKTESGSRTSTAGRRRSGPAERREEAGRHEERGGGERGPEAAEGGLLPVGPGETRGAREPVDDDGGVPHRDREDDARQLVPQGDPQDFEDPRDGGERRLAPAARAVRREHLGNRGAPSGPQPPRRDRARRDVRAEQRRERADPGHGEDDEERPVAAEASLPRDVERRGGQRHEGGRDDERRSGGAGSEDRPEEERERRRARGQQEAPGEAFRRERGDAEAPGRERQQERRRRAAPPRSRPRPAPPRRRRTTS